jgi:dipeptidyl aminopeptidase/acylaminoacyl peptidase
MKTKIGKSKTILVFVALLALFLAISLLLFPPGQPMDVTGPYTIGIERYTYTDEKRTEIYIDVGENRQVNVVFWYPEGTGGVEPYPLVVFSHGGLGTENSNESLYRELASHGYIVCAIGHPFTPSGQKAKMGVRLL